ncbi:MAG: sensor histidine kinase, partial [Candidatus Sericytochromatia bacterium]
EDVDRCLGQAERGYLAEITAATDQLQTLVNDLLDMGRIQAGRFALYPAPTDLTGMIHEAIQHLEVLLKRKALTLEAKVDELPELVVDPDRVHQVLLNLLTNAIKFTPEGGRIEVTARRTGSTVRCEVKDSGPGIPEALQERIFERFGQVDTASTRQAGGTGLGLSISKAIVDGHGGRIGVTSAPGHGSTFWFTLPGPRGRASGERGASRKSRTKEAV